MKREKGLKNVADGFDKKQLHAFLDQTNVPGVRMTGKRKRFEALMPLVDGKRTPRWIRCYDNGGTEGTRKHDGRDIGTIDRYTVVFSGRYTHKTGRQHWDVCMSESPYHPQGVGMHGESNGPIDRPTSGHLGKRIKFMDLPADCQRLIIDDYTYLWDIRAEMGLSPNHASSIDPFGK